MPRRRTRSKKNKQPAAQNGKKDVNAQKIKEVNSRINEMQHTLRSASHPRQPGAAHADKKNTVSKVASAHVPGFDNVLSKLLPTSLEAAQLLLQPDYVAKHGPHAVPHKPGIEVPTVAFRVSGVTEYTLQAGHTALIVLFPCSYVNYEPFGGSVTTANYIIGVIIDRQDNAVPLGTPWPIPYGATGVWQMATGYTFTPLYATDGVDLFTMAVQKDWQFAVVGGNNHCLVPATMNTQVVASGMYLPTGSSCAFHTPPTDSQLRQGSLLPVETRVVNMETPGWNIRYAGDQNPGVYDWFPMNTIAKNADETAEVQRQLRDGKLREQICIALSKMSDRTPPTLDELKCILQSSEVNAITEAPPEVNLTFPLVLVSNTAEQSEQLILTTTWYLNAMATESSGLSMGISPADPNWGEVIRRSFESAYFVGPNSFGSFFKSLWGGAKDAISSVVNKGFDVLKSGAQAAVPAFLQAGSQALAQHMGGG